MDDLVDVGAGQHAQAGLPVVALLGRLVRHAHDLDALQRGPDSLVRQSLGQRVHPPVLQQQTDRQVREPGLRGPARARVHQLADLDGPQAPHGQVQHPQARQLLVGAEAFEPLACGGRGAAVAREGQDPFVDLFRFLLLAIFLGARGLASFFVGVGGSCCGCVLGLDLLGQLVSPFGNEVEAGAHHALDDQARQFLALNAGQEITVLVAVERVAYIHQLQAFLRGGASFGRGGVEEATNGLEEPGSGERIDEMQILDLPSLRKQLEEPLGVLATRVVDAVDQAAEERDAAQIRQRTRQTRQERRRAGESQAEQLERQVRDGLGQLVQRRLHDDGVRGRRGHQPLVVRQLDVGGQRQLAQVLGRVVRGEDGQFEGLQRDLGCEWVGVARGGWKGGGRHCCGIV